jgi:hypothetical protein
LPDDLLSPYLCKAVTAGAAAAVLMWVLNKMLKIKTD